MQYRTLDLDDISWALPLNQDHVTELSSLTSSRFADLIGDAFLAAAIAPNAFLLTFDQDAGYDSPNFLWFKQRYPRFVYIDRVVVSPLARGKGLAKILYDALFARAKEAGQEMIVCEVNSAPPNPASDAFHQRLGFAEVGMAALTERQKTVRYLAKQL